MISLSFNCLMNFFNKKGEIFIFVHIKTFKIEKLKERYYAWMHQKVLDAFRVFNK